MSLPSVLSLQFNHFSLHVAQLPESIHFYGQVLGLQQIDRPAFDFDGAWFAIGPGLELHLIAGRVQPVSSSKRGAHYAFYISDLQAAIVHLQAQNIPIQGPFGRPDGAQQVFINDPDDYVVELCSF